MFRHPRCILPFAAVTCLLGCSFEGAVDEATSSELRGTVTVTPNPVPAFGASYTVNVRDLRPSYDVELELSEPTCCATVQAHTSDSGEVAVTRTSGAPGSYVIEAYELRSNGRWDRRLVARYEFRVVDDTTMGDAGQPQDAGPTPTEEDAGTPATEEDAGTTTPPPSSSGVFSADSVWNAALPATAPVHAQSSAIIDWLRTTNGNDGCVMIAGAAGNRWGTPVYYASASDPVYDVDTVRYRVPPEFDMLRIPAHATSGDNADAEMVIYDPGQGTVALLSKALYDASLDRWTVSGGTIAYLDSNGVARNVRDGDPRNYDTFRGQNGYVHAVTVEQANSGHVRHLMRVAVDDSAPSHLWPLNGHDGSAGDASAPPQGAILRIRPDIDVSSYGLAGQALAIARGMQSHGIIITDSSGGNIVLKLEDTVREGRGELWTLSSTRALCGIPLTDFVVVDYAWSSSRPGGS